MRHLSQSRKFPNKVTSMETQKDGRNRSLLPHLSSLEQARILASFPPTESEDKEYSIWSHCLLLQT
jgi:hypothetical protein